MKLTLIIAGALLAGFAGGVLGTFVSRPDIPGQLPGVIRARSFELVSKAGHTVSYWGADDQNNAVLAFGKPGTFAGRPGARPVDSDKDRVAIGLWGDLGFLKFRAPDGKTRVRLLVDIDGKPTLLMEDESGVRVSLGVARSDTPGPQDNDWSLALHPERARIGMVSRETAGVKYVHGFFFLDKTPIKYP